MTPNVSLTSDETYPIRKKHPHNKCNSDQQMLAGVALFSRKPNSGETTVVGGGNHKTERTLQNSTWFLLLRSAVILSSKTSTLYYYVEQIGFNKSPFNDYLGPVLPTSLLLGQSAQRGIAHKYLFGISVK